MRRHRGICHWCGKPGADRIDHVDNTLPSPLYDSDANKRPIHDVPCHAEKTQQESAAARWPNH